MIHPADCPTCWWGWVSPFLYLALAGGWVFVLVAVRAMLSDRFNLIDGEW